MFLHVLICVFIFFHHNPIRWRFLLGQSSRPGASVRSHEVRGNHMKRSRLAWGNYTPVFTHTHTYIYIYMIWYDMIVISYVGAMDAQMRKNICEGQNLPGHLRIPYVIWMWLHCRRWKVRVFILEIDGKYACFWILLCLNQIHPASKTGVPPKKLAQNCLIVETFQDITPTQKKHAFFLPQGASHQLPWFPGALHVVGLVDAQVSAGGWGIDPLHLRRDGAAEQNQRDRGESAARDGDGW